MVSNFKKISFLVCCAGILPIVINGQPVSGEDQFDVAFSNIDNRFKGVYKELFIDEYNKQKMELFYRPLAPLMKKMKAVKRNHTNDSHVEYCDAKLEFESNQFDQKYLNDPHRCYLNPPYINFISSYFALKYHKLSSNSSAGLRSLNNVDLYLDQFVGTFKSILECQAKLFKWKESLAVQLFKDTIKCYEHKEIHTASENNVPPMKNGIRFDRNYLPAMALFVTRFFY